MSIYSSMRSAVRLGTVEALKQAGYSTTPVIYSHQNAPEPSSSYVVVQVVNINQVGRKEEATFTDDSVPKKNLIYKNHYEAVIQFTFAGTDAPDMGTEFHNSILGSVVVREAYQKNHLAPIRKSGLRRSPQKRDTQWVEFFNVDVTFSYMVYTKQEIDWVDHVSIVDVNSGEIITVPPLPQPTP